VKKALHDDVEEEEEEEEKLEKHNYVMETWT
jgi:hypothetical protein